MPRPDPPPFTVTEELLVSATIKYAWQIGRESPPTPKYKSYVPAKYLICDATLTVNGLVVKHARAIWQAVQRPAPGKWRPVAIDAPVLGRWPEIPVDYPPRTRAISKVRDVRKDLRHG